MRVLTGLLVVLFAAPAIAQETPTALSELDRAIAELVTTNAVPGASIAIIEGDQITLAKGYGLADKAKRQKVETSTLFKGGSLSKNITSLLALKLAADGVISLDEKLSDLLPDASPRNPWDDKHPIRLIHLLEHTAGLEGSSYVEYSTNVRDGSPSAYALAMKDKLRVRWQPGFFYSYSNPGHTLLAAALEARTGKNFDTLAREVLFTPLGMTNTVFSRFSADQSRLAKSYDKNGKSEEPYWDMTIRPSGAIVSTPSDLANLVKLYLARGRIGDEVFIPAEMIAAMETSSSSAGSRSGLAGGSYGAGNFGFLDRGHLFQGHWGSTEGFRTHLGYSVAANGGYVIMVNANDGTSHAIRDLVAGYITRKLPKPDPVRANGPRNHTTRAVDGWYRPFTHEMPFRAWVMDLFTSAKVTRLPDGKLRVQSIVPFSAADTLIYAGADTFRHPDAPISTVAFAQDANGEIVLINGSDSMRHVGPLRTLLPFYLLATALAVGALLVVYGVVAGFLALFRKRAMAPDWTVRLAMVVSGACLVGLSAMFVMIGLLGDKALVMMMGQFSAVSFTMAALSLLGPIALIIALVRAPYLKGTSRIFATFATLALIFVSAGWLILGANGWVPFITWAH